MDLRSPPEDEIKHITNVLEKHNKTQLQAVCAINSLPKNGNKPDLKARIIKRKSPPFISLSPSPTLRVVSVDILGQMGSINNGSMTPAPSFAPAGGNSRTYAYAPPLPYGLVNGQRAQNATLPGPGNAARYPIVQAQQRAPPVITPGFTFKSSPFYQMKQRLGDMKTLMAQHRASVAMYVRAEDIQQCFTDQSMRVLMFCAGGNTGLQDVSFPHQAELKVNGGDVKANLRGLKGKAGSTRPVDITASLRMRPHTYINSIDFTYALTSKAGRPPRSMTEKANDPDIVATSLNLSLKCPLTYMKLKTPCRGVNCSHSQCFDAVSYLQLQEQGPQWVCPICNKPAPFDQLATDEYVREILNATPDELDQVTIDPFGKWSLPGAKKPAKTVSHQASIIDDDDVVVSYASNPAASASTSKTPASTVSLTGTPNSATPPSTRTGSKRQAPEVIDLTLSDDDEPEVRAPKRPNMGQNGFHGVSY
ncbi:hypothetical protein OQA88_7582 [Cercophora sp. LCS_1]